MEKPLFMRGGSYHQEGNYFIPKLFVLKLPSIGIRGQWRKQYMKKHCQALYMALLLSGKLNNLPV